MQGGKLAWRHVDLAEGILRLIDFLLQPHLGVLDAAAPFEIEDVVDALQEHRDAFEAVGDLAGDRREVDAADLLEVGELGDLHAVEHDLPADAPRAECRGLPVVLFESNVVLAGIDPAGLEAVEIQLLHFIRRRLEDDLVLMMFEQAVRVLPKSPVVRPPRRLNVRDAPRLLPEHAKQRFRM